MNSDFELQVGNFFAFAQEHAFVESPHLANFEFEAGAVKVVGGENDFVFSLRYHLV